MNAIILSAGLGKRLRPITNVIPKPLLPIVSCPIIEINIQRLINIGVKFIGINLYYKADMIKKFLNEVPGNLCVAIEDQLRGTGGALLNFKELLKDDLIIHNCDVLSNINLTKAINFHKLHKPFATLLLTKNMGTNFFKINKNFQIEEFAQKDTKNYYTYTGIAILSEKIFSFLPEKDFFSIIDVYQKLIEGKGLIMGFPTKELWYDIGFPNKYWKIHYEILNQKVKLDEIDVNSDIYIHPSSVVRTKNLKGFISIGPNCFISKKASLKNTIVFENSRIEDGNFEKCLLSETFCIKIK